ncbi:MAG: HAD family acid phosphatase [Opitutaceae bacterium]|nr:HAD family acid phosphatase [Opitutaceae bacterium]
MSRSIRVAGLLVLAAGFGGCATTHEPPNLDPHKQQIRRYVDSGEYQRDIAVVTGRAQAWIARRAAQRKPGERLAVVLDLDETLFLNWPHLRRNDLGYVESVWLAWVESAQAPAIEPVRELYRSARRLGVATLLVTGRPETQRAATERNLRAIDCTDYAALVCRPAGQQGSSAGFKTAARQRLERDGWTLIANIGDQESDLVGGHAERTFKLPAPFYLTE